MYVTCVLCLYVEIERENRVAVRCSSVVKMSSVSGRQGKVMKHLIYLGEGYPVCFLGGCCV